jgi:hypothetical protein
MFAVFVVERMDMKKRHVGSHNIISKNNRNKRKTKVKLLNLLILLLLIAIFL